MYPAAYWINILGASKTRKKETFLVTKRGIIMTDRTLDVLLLSQKKNSM
jgi:hypothetical protein